MNLYTQAESNIRKTWLYLSFFLILVVAIGWAFSYYVGDVRVLYVATGFSVFINIIAYWHSDKIVLQMSGAKPIAKSDNPELYRLVENLCITAGLPLPKIYVIESYQANAFAAGRDANHAVVAVTRGLLEKLERVELEGVIAHELSHIGNKDMLLQTVIVVLVGIIVVLTDLFWRIAIWGGMGKNDSRSGGQFRTMMMLVAVVLAALAPIFAQLIKLAISRKREFLADASGALLTRYPEGLARALEKIAMDESPLRGANDSTAHLYIANPFRGNENKSWLHKIYMTHPPIGERIKALRGMKM
jgi:heat shock protein HtpX